MINLFIVDGKKGSLNVVCYNLKTKGNGKNSVLSDNYEIESEI